jgi:hypothetical protein
VSDTDSKKIKRSKSVTRWGGILKFDKPAPSAVTERVLGAIEAGLVKFEEHKTALITILRIAHNRDPKSEPFNEVKTWRSLTSCAHTYHWEAIVKQETIPVADRVSRLGNLANALGKARELTDKAMQDDQVCNDLFWAWCEGANEPLQRIVRKNKRTFTLVQAPQEAAFNNLVMGIAALETVALKAKTEVEGKKSGKGRPKSTSVLPPGHILALANVYRKSTGRKPSADKALFARLVREFLSAVGRENHTRDQPMSERHLLEIIEAALTKAPSP